MTLGIVIGIVVAILLALLALPMVGFWLMDKFNNAGVDKD